MPSWKKVIISGSNAALNSLNVSTSLTASGIIYPTTDGTSGQVVITDGNGNLSFSNIENTTITIKNMSGGTIAKGTPCYITGSGTSGNLAGVWPADASNPLRMPAGVIAGESLTAGAEGVGLINGYISGVNTSAFAAGDSVYVAVGGGYTKVRPTGSSVLIQKLGNVEKSHASNGSGVINGPGYYNEVPNIQQGFTWVGNSNGVAIAVATSSIQNVVSASFASTASFLNSNTNAFIQNGNSFGATALLGTNDNQSLALETNGTTRMFISSSGNVGINTTASTVALQVGDTTSGAGNYIKVLGNNSDSTYDVFVGARRYPRFTLEDTTVGGSAFQMWSLGNTMRFGTNTGTTETSAWYTKAGNAADVIFNGRIGIGVISPGLRLSVSASSNSDGIQVIQSGTSRIELKGDGTAVWGSAADFGRLTWDTGKAILQGQSGKALSLGANNSSDHLYINTSANVGIGTTSPGAKLDVNGNTIITGSLAVSQSLLQYSNITAVTSGSTSNVASFNTSSYTAAFFDYVATSGTNARAGSVFTVWNGANVEYTETSTNDIGSTTNLLLSASVSAGAVRLQATSLSGSWSVKTLARML